MKKEGGGGEGARDRDRVFSEKERERRGRLGTGQKEIERRRRKEGTPLFDKKGQRRSFHYPGIDGRVPADTPWARGRGGGSWD